MGTLPPRASARHRFDDVVGPHLSAMVRQVVEDWLGPLLESVASRLERSGHEADVQLDAGLTLPEPSVPSQHAELRLLPRALPGQRIVRPMDRQPMVRFQLDAADGVVRVWARDVSLDGRDVLVGYRNDDEGQPISIPVEALNEAFVWRQVLDTVDFAMRASAQEPLFP